MLIGIPKEIKNNENRVALTPAGVHSLVSRGHRVLIETNAGLGSGFTDADYQKQGQLPLLVPMSEVAGRMAVQIGAHFLTKQAGGSGVLLGGVPGVPKGKVTIIGDGVVGTHAARIALGLGAQVTILDISAKRLSVLEEVFGSQIQTLMSNSFNIEASVRDADVVIGAILIPGAKAPELVTDEMVKQMRPGSVSLTLLLTKVALSKQLTV
ncbi:alanine dehydrogenase [Streptococcus pneumoniae]|nr:alanine dehydrogenase [Streptococcus pneumoniae]CJA35451.1 alanine dehydrogenase [Streptococcus pneumoniae]CJF42103.1 alanine dehydrogenase [Streptococcus pneumoniae]CJK84932.1 alanine dehydrogenase [Streptococcus pneumoniae]CJM97493.1 alanine dehydrogenase [Streptococcus pneumoniae]